MVAVVVDHQHAARLPAQREATVDSGQAGHRLLVGGEGDAEELGHRQRGQGVLGVVHARHADVGGSAQLAANADHEPGPLGGGLEDLAPVVAAAEAVAGVALEQIRCQR